MLATLRCYNIPLFFFNDTATTEIYTRSLVGQRQMCIRDSLDLERLQKEERENLISVRRGEVDQQRKFLQGLDLSLIHISEPTRPY